MKHILLLFVLTLPLNVTGQKSKLNDESVAVATALEKVKEATSELAQNGYFNGTFDVSVKFNDVVSDENGLEFKIWFLSFTKQRNRSIDNSYTANYQFETTEKTSLTAYEFSSDLAEILSNGIQAYKSVEPYPLTRNGFEIVSSFTLERSGEGGASIELSPISIGATKKRQRKSVHTITLTFSPKAK
ncbi:trypco2 family protein [Zobellia galactanivorans]|uniref:Conserved hypothetical periplasmic protein n=1 Tax=Zobellia galactanivorans (strain DSM 12802 / CCUG 47099 / CIP 106680 / NCIMB 13871 / Dsij) TaxID=63186 RepID=G0KZG2_ZOBGA|nr:trypco2 family protein [Zobellia galactanivorans]CAZ98448.1 Conserved hypothetical periplasmic protein [Zobellia galactanivorans]